MVVTVPVAGNGFLRKRTMAKWPRLFYLACYMRDEHDGQVRGHGNHNDDNERQWSGNGSSFGCWCCKQKNRIELALVPRHETHTHTHTNTVPRTVPYKQANYVATHILKCYTSQNTQYVSGSCCCCVGVDRFSFASFFKDARFRGDEKCSLIKHAGWTVRLYACTQNGRSGSGQGEERE